MKLISLYALLIVTFSLFACSKDRNQVGEQGLAILFAGEFNEADEASRVTNTAFEQGDQLGVYIVNENQQLAAAGNRVNNVCFTVGDDGLSTSSPALYYPDQKQAITVHAYYPYQATIANATKLEFSVQSDQTKAENIKKSDLCYARQSVTPSEDAQTLQFSHLLSKVVLNIAMSSNGQSVDNVKFVDAAVDLKLDLSNGAITAGATRAPISTKNEVIIPPQTFAANTKMVAVDVKLADGTAETYYFTPLTALTFESSKVTTINLILNDNKTAELSSAPQVTSWLTGTSSGEIKNSVNNKINIHWLPAHPRAAEVNRIVLTIKNATTSIVKDYEITKLTATNSVFSFDFAADDLTYPYTVTKIALYKGNETIENSLYVLLSNSIYKAGEHNLGAGNGPINPPTSNDYITVGGLKWTKGNLIAVGTDGCKVGTSTDAGLTFQFGSLVGWNPTTTATVAIAVRPAGYTGGTTWTTVGYYKDGTSGTIPTTDTPTTGIGDPCRYYLGGKWRLPTTAEYRTLFNNYGGGAWSGSGASWNGSGCNVQGLFFPAAGFRNSSDGSLYAVGSFGYYWSASVSNASGGYYLGFNSSNVSPQGSGSRANGFPVRCVSAP